MQRPCKSDHNEDGARTADERVQTKPKKIYIDAREWEGRDLNQAVLDESLTADQAISIMKLRQACSKPVPDDAQDELIAAMWDDLKADREQPDDSKEVATQSVTTAVSGERAAILRTDGMPCSMSCIAEDVSLLSFGAGIRGILSVF